MAEDPRRTLRELAQRHGYSNHSLMLIMQAAVRLTDAQVRQVIDAVETCALSGLTERLVHDVIARHRATARDWRASFWAERLELASQAYNRQLARERAAASVTEQLLLGDCQPSAAPIGAQPPTRSDEAPPVAPIPPQPPVERNSAPHIVRADRLGTEIAAKPVA